MSTVARKAKNDIEFMEGEALRSNKPVDWQHCEAMISLFLEAVSWIQKASDPLVELDANACEELIGLSQRGLQAANRIEAECAEQLEARRMLQKLPEFRETANALAVLRDNLLKHFESAEAASWAKIEAVAPPNQQLLDSAQKHRAPQAWYEERSDISPLEVPAGEQTTEEGRNHSGAAE